jgi:hypothetical protein
MELNMKKIIGFKRLTIYKKKSTEDFFYIENGKKKGIMQADKLNDIINRKEISITKTYNQISNNDLKWLLKKTKDNEKDIEILYHNGYLYFQNLYFTEGKKKTSFFQKLYFRREKYQEIESQCLFNDCKEMAIGSHIYSNGTELNGVGDLYKIDANYANYIERFKDVNIKKIIRQDKEKRLDNCTKKLYCDKHDPEIFNKLDKCNNKEMDYNFAKQLTIRNISSNIFEINEIITGTQIAYDSFKEYKIKLNSIYDIFLTTIKNQTLESQNKSIEKFKNQKEKLENLLNLFINNNESYVYKVFKIKKNESFLSYYSMNEDFRDIKIKEEGNIVFTSKIKNKNKGEFIVVAIPNNENKEKLLKRYEKINDFIWLDFNSYDLLLNEPFLKKYFNYGNENKLENLKEEIFNIHRDNYNVTGFKKYIENMEVEKEFLLEN